MNLTYATDPTKRCMYCKGREVKAYMGDNLLHNNLEFTNGFYHCKDKKECQRNLEADNTQVIISEKGYKIVKDHGKAIVEVEFVNGIEELQGDYNDGR